MSSKYEIRLKTIHELLEDVGRACGYTSADYKIVKILAEHYEEKGLTYNQSFAECVGAMLNSARLDKKLARLEKEVAELMG